MEMLSIEIIVQREGDFLMWLKSSRDVEGILLEVFWVED